MGKSIAAEREKNIMNKKSDLLSIGEMSKFCNVHAKSLRYYEQINILKPSFVDPDSGYRYYSLDQSYLVRFIMFCIELGIPLKELAKFLDSDNTVDYRAFLKKGKEIANMKLKTIEEGLKYIDKIEQQINLIESHSCGEIYKREFSEKIFYVIPHAESLEKIDPLDLANSFDEMPYNEVNFNNDYSELPQFGMLYEHYPTEIQYYTFMELPKHMEKGDNIKIIPAGTYYCSYSENSQINQASEVFKKYLTGKDSFLAIETQVLVSRFKINKPMYELKIIGL